MKNSSHGAGFIDFSDARSIYHMLKSKYNGDVSNEKLKAYLNKGVAAAAEGYIQNIMLIARSARVKKKTRWYYRWRHWCGTRNAQ